MLTFIDVLAAAPAVGNPLIDRAYATDFPEQIGGLDAVLVDSVMRCSRHVAELRDMEQATWVQPQSVCW